MRHETILVIEDDVPIVELIDKYLSAEGFVVHAAYDGPSGLKQARTVKPDLVVLDIMLPGMDGFEVCRLLQQEMDVYVLMLTARAEEMDKVVGLSVGADDYLTKPFSPRELVARVKAILRRQRKRDDREPLPPERPSLAFEEIQIDPETREVNCHLRPVELTQREFELLYTLAEQPGRVFSRDQLLERVWGHDFAGIDRVVDVTVGILRRKLDDDPANPTLIQTIRGVGYKLVARRAKQLPNEPMSQGANHKITESPRRRVTRTTHHAGSVPSDAIGSSGSWQIDHVAPTAALEALHIPPDRHRHRRCHPPADSAILRA